MDLGIQGRHALVCGASKGLGRACAEALLREGVHVTIVARSAEALDVTRAELENIAQHSGGSVHAVACDITTGKGRGQGIEGLSVARHPGQ